MQIQWSSISCALRSTFLAALTNLHDLQTKSEHCLDRINKLRTWLHDVDKNSARGARDGLEMQDNQRCRENNRRREGFGRRRTVGWSPEYYRGDGQTLASQRSFTGKCSCRAFEILTKSGLHNRNGDAHGSSNPLPATPEEEPSKAQQIEETQPQNIYHIKIPLHYFHFVHFRLFLHISVCLP